MRTHPSHIHTTPHPDGPRRFTELLDIDAFKVDRDSDTKVYGLRYTDEPDEHGRFWILQEFGEEIFTDELVKIGPAGDPSYLSDLYFEYNGGNEIIISTTLSITNLELGDGLQLVNDSDTPIVDMYQFYGMDPAGTKGWYILDASFTYYDDSVTNLGDTVQIAIDNLWTLVNADAIFQYPFGAFTYPNVPTTRPDATPIKAGDRFEIVLGGTIPLLEPYADLDIGDVLVARVDGASAVGDFFAMQGNVDNATLLQAREGLLDDFTYMTPRTNVERIMIDDAGAQAAIVDEADRMGAIYSGSVAGIYKRQRYNDMVNDYTYRYDGADLRRTYNSQSITGKFTVFPGLPTTITHNLGSRNYHIEFFDAGTPIELEVEEASDTYMIVRSVTPGNYQYSITRAPDSGVNGFVSTAAGTELFDLRLFLSNTTIPAGAVSNMIYLDGFYYIPDRDAKVLMKVNADTLAVSTLNINAVAQHVSTDFEYLYLSASDNARGGGDDYLIKVDIATFTEDSRVNISGYEYQAQGIPALDGSDYPVIPLIINDYVYLTCYGYHDGTPGNINRGCVLKINKNTLVIEDGIAVTNAFYMVQANNNLLVTDYAAGTVHKIDLSTFTDVATLNPAGSLGNIIFWRDRAYLAGYSAQSVYEIDPIAFNVTDTELVGKDVWKINNYGSKAGLCFYLHNEIAEFDLIDFNLTGRTIAYPAPTGIDFF